jgi:dihydroorotate dehydrogenase (NAD+) catalytic subunit
VQVGTANFINPRATIDIIEGLKGFLIERGILNVTDIIGTLKV